MSQGVWLEELSWIEAKARFESGAVVLIPVGTIAKEHGAHLPLNTDWLIARALASRVADVLPIASFPEALAAGRN
jgi:creatinine amidohydrolase